jgi:hypothetical protein
LQLSLPNHEASDASQLETEIQLFVEVHISIEEPFAVASFFWLEKQRKKEGKKKKKKKKMSSPSNSSPRKAQLLLGRSRMSSSSGSLPVSNSRSSAFSSSASSVASVPSSASASTFATWSTEERQAGKKIYDFFRAFVFRRRWLRLVKVIMLKQSIVKRVEADKEAAIRKQVWRFLFVLFLFVCLSFVCVNFPVFRLLLSCIVFGSAAIALFLEWSKA